MSLTQLMPTFVGTGDGLGGRGIDDLLADEVGEDAHQFVGPIVFLVDFFVVAWCTVRHQHDGLVTLGALYRSIVLLGRRQSIGQTPYIDIASLINRSAHQNPSEC